jgi:hypothetical protein
MNALKMTLVPALRTGLLITGSVLEQGITFAPSDPGF